MLKTEEFVIPVRRTEPGTEEVRDGQKIWRSGPTIVTSERVRVEVNFELLALQLGPKAARSKGKKAVESSGAVVVRYLGQVEPPPSPTSNLTDLLKASIEQAKARNQ